MQDQFGRGIDYLRISVTDRCNLRCKYCMPEDIESVPMSQVLTLEEIARIAACGAGLGIRHIKLTGGEPLVRKGLTDLLRMLKRTPGIEKVTMTTNGILLAEKLPELLSAGLDAVNISLDTLDRSVYTQITGMDGLETVRQAVRASCDSGLQTKINAVSLDLGQENIKGLVDLAEALPLDVRFIEMMPIGAGRDYPVVDHRALLDLLQEWYPGLEPDDRKHGFGPARYYRIPGYQGSVGLISAIHGKFCQDCNRVRLTSQGYLKTCLCYDTGRDLRSILRKDLPETDIERELREAMADAIYHKPEAHCFENPEEITEKKKMSMIGG